jgi:hypothetical protein
MPKKETYRTNDDVIVQKTTIGSYLALTGIYFLLGICSIIIGIYKNDMDFLIKSAACSFFIGSSFLIWLMGFRLKIDEYKLMYRDGFFRKTIIPLDSITKVDCKLVTFSYLWKKIRIPRIAISYEKNKELIINPKPFPSGLLQYIQQEVAKSRERRNLTEAI